VHVSQPERAVAEARRLLALGGRLAFTTWRAQDNAADEFTEAAIAEHGIAVQLPKEASNDVSVGSVSRGDPRLRRRGGRCRATPPGDCRDSAAQRSPGISLAPTVAFERLDPPLETARPREPDSLRALRRAAEKEQLERAPVTCGGGKLATGEPGSLRKLTGETASPIRRALSRIGLPDAEARVPR
jgi:hypothetical protein